VKLVFIGSIALLTKGCYVSVIVLHI